MFISKKLIYAVFAVVILVGAGALAKELFLSDSGSDRNRESEEAAANASEPVGAARLTPEPVKPGKTFPELVEQYGSLPLIDAHNHDAVNNQYSYRKESWKKYSVDQVILFGNSSEWILRTRGNRGGVHLLACDVCCRVEGERSNGRLSSANLQALRRV